MKNIIKIVILCSMVGTVAAQNHVSNIRVQQSDEQLIVTYDLETTADVEAFVSFDGGVTYKGPLQHVFGAVGKDVLPGKDKVLLWNVLREFGAVDNPNTVMKIVATDKKPAITVIAVDGNSESIRGYYSRFGIETGEGLSETLGPYYSYYDIGLRYTQKWEKYPYFGVDYKVELGLGEYSYYSYYEEGYDYDYSYIVRALAGIRYNIPHFGRKKNMTVSSTLRLGISYNNYYDRDRYDRYDPYYYNRALSFYVELGRNIQFGRLYFGYTYGLDGAGLFLGGRLGVDIGKRISFR